MCNPFALLHDIHDLDSPKLADIERLATGSGVEGGLVQVDAAGIVRALDDGRLEIAEVGVGIIESVGHREPGASEWFIPVEQLEQEGYGQYLSRFQSPSK